MPFDGVERFTMPGTRLGAAFSFCALPPASLKTGTSSYSPLRPAAKCDKRLTSRSSDSPDERPTARPAARQVRSLEPLPAVGTCGPLHWAAAPEAFAAHGGDRRVIQKEVAQAFANAELQADQRSQVFARAPGRLRRGSGGMRAKQCARSGREDRTMRGAEGR